MIDFNDNWMDSANEQAIIDSGLAPSNNLESAILTTLDPQLHRHYSREQWNYRRGICRGL